MPWLLLSLASALFLGLYDVAKKLSLDKNAVVPVLFACSLAGVVVLLPAYGLSLAWPSLAESLGVFVSPLSLVGHLLVLVKAAIVTVSWLLTFFAIKHLPLSLASPIRATAPLFTVLGAFVLFQERPAPRQWGGILIILGCYWAFSVIGRREGVRFEKNRWVLLLFLGTLVASVSGLYDKELMQKLHLAPMAVQFWFTFYNAVLQGMVLLLVRAWEKSPSTPFEFRRSILAVALLLILADAVYFRARAYPSAMISVVSILRRTNVIVTFAVGMLVFREKQRLAKLGAIAGVVFGLVLLLR